ncbi:aminotransferase class III-fold pyridoxal phosphate-dependent enzyme [Hyphococcus lacteus]|uniref:Aminotransferase class III-fold pyridoxal phosphate-dependent enzyme n=1 Tax=Hyphococcus lacteus TaxID=3143536 RepID=A0ABV3Z303_9PROT
MTEQTSGNRAGRILTRLTELAAELSGFDVTDLSPDQTFLELGFDSLFMTQLATSFQKEFNVKITFRQLISEYPTLNAILGFLDQSLPQEALAEEPVAHVAPEPEPSSVPIGSPDEIAPTLNTGPQNVNTDGLAAIFAEQVSLMAKQLELLRASKTTVPTIPTPITDVAKAVAVKPTADRAETKPSVPTGFGPKVDAGASDKDVLTLSQQAHIDRLVARYNKRTEGSKAQTQADRAHHADPRTAAGFNPLWKEMVYPIVVKKSLGAHLWDVDDNQYIDILNGFGPNFFGHRAPFITDALKAQLDSGYEVGPQTPRAGDAAKLLCELTGMDRVSWVNTGSEAVQAAIRISRTVTGRDKIVVFKGDYHGNFDEVLVRGVTTAKGEGRTLPLAPGIPFQSVDNVIVVDYGEPSALETIQKHASEIAAVLVEPVQSRRPEFQPREFLHELRALTQKEGIVLVFDEVITGFRIRPGGAQEYFGIKADLATYGKIIGGGMPIGVVAGRSEFMDTFDGGMWQYGDDSIPSAGVTFFAGTFVRHPMAIAAAYASLQYLQNAGPGLQERVNKLATRLATELNEFFDERGVDIFVAHFASQMFIRVNEQSDLATLFFYHMRDRGIHVLEHFPSYMTAAHTDEDVDRIIAAAKDSIYEMQSDGILESPESDSGVIAGWSKKIGLTNAQKEVWIASQMGEMESCAFNESDSFEIDGDLDLNAFRSAVEDTLNQNEAFRLRFDAGGEFQSTAGSLPIELSLTDLSSLGADGARQQLAAQLEKLALTAFDLEKGPLVRANLFCLEASKHVFVIYCHHIIFDGYSAELMIQEITDRYAAKVSGGVRENSDLIPFGIYAERMENAGNEIPTYWLKVFAEDHPEPLDLPTDRPRGAKRQYNGNTVHRELPQKLCLGVKEAAKQLGVSQFALLLSAYSALLSRLTSQEDMVIGVPTAGQARENIDAIGYCVNILPVRTNPGFEDEFSDFAKGLQKATFDAFDNQNLSISDLMNRLKIPRDPSRLALIETVFNFSRYFSGVSMPGCTLTARENRRFAVYHDLFFNIVDAGECLVIDWDYAADLFDEETISRWIDHYIALLSDIVRHPKKRIGDLSLIVPEGSADILSVGPNG